MDGDRLMVIENSVLRINLSLRGRKGQETGENFIIRNFMISTPCHILE
jgi:hypothetical protein